MLSGAVDLTIQVERPELVEGTGVGSTLTECPHIFPESLTQELDGTLDEGTQGTILRWIIRDELHLVVQRR